MPIAVPEAAHALGAHDVLGALGSSPDGLHRSESERRLKQFGPNTLRRTPPRPAWRILIDQLASVVALLLVAAAAVAAVAGDVAEAIAIAAVLVINVAIGFWTEMRARRALDALIRLEVPRARVLREGVPEAIDARQLVPGDVIVLESGDAIPADARLVDAHEARVDEAALTGESLPVAKHADAEIDAAVPLPERATMLYRGTSLVAGTARGVVVATGETTELGRIGVLVRSVDAERTPLERRLDRLGRRLIGAALAVGALVTVLGVLRGETWDAMLKTGLALAIAAVPEGLPATITIALAVGVHRMARRGVLTRRLPAVESLGAATIICTDKTGTLTAGRQTITTICTGDEPVELDAAVDDAATRRLLGAAMLAGEATLERQDGEWRVIGDPTDGAFLIAAREAGLEGPDAAPVAKLPFSSERKLMAVFHEESGERVARVKGAPREVLDLCTRVADGSGGTRPLDAAARERVEAANASMASRGLRVLGVAEGPVATTDADGLHDLAFLGLAGMIDPPADGVPETLVAFRAAGIRTVMITGDQRRTAEAIGRSLGVLAGEETVLDGRELATLGPAELAERVQTVGAFSRTSPEDKLRLVEAFRARGDIVAMLGDGVNDAAALRRADVGVAMGGRGTDVAREAAGVVLEDDRFPTIGAAIEEGRVIHDNIRKFVFYLSSCNLAEVMVLLAAGVAGLPLPLLPLQILWLNLVTDTFPALSLALEPGERDVMRRPPRDPQRDILSGSMVRLASVWALVLAGVTLAAFLTSLGDDSIERARTACFMTLGLAQLFHLFTARSPGPLSAARVFTNRWALGAIVLVIALQLAAVYVTPLADLLGLVPPGASDWAKIIPLSLMPAVAAQVMKRVRPRRAQASSTTSAMEPDASP